MINLLPQNDYAIGNGYGGVILLPTWAKGATLFTSIASMVATAKLQVWLLETFYDPTGTITDRWSATASCGTAVEPIIEVGEGAVSAAFIHQPGPFLKVKWILEDAGANFSVWLAPNSDSQTQRIIQA